MTFMLILGWFAVLAASYVGAELLLRVSGKL